ncbi:LPS export ABC transporter periplasmic protein LptC [Marinobacter sp. M1N3S26]|uniref:LPS export ABC transporter periplasmic protein LptC n=1 Tax=unclassified Marinobacter TaxID=83889 RepID=UPI00387A9C45
MASENPRHLLLRVLDFLARPGIRNPGLLIAVVALGFLLWHSDEPATVDTDAMELRGASEPDTFINDGEFRSFDTQGRPKLVASSPRTEQFDDRRQAVLEAPDATLYDHEADLRWLLDANHGLYHMDTEVMELEGNVEVTRSVEGGNAILLTEYLRIDNPAGRATTDRPVTLKSPGSITHARGMTGWFDERVLELENSVEGIYETRQ